MWNSNGLARAWPRIAALALCWLLLPVAALAQGWQMRRFDDGSFFMYSIAPAGGSAIFTLLCGERSPTGLTAMQTGNMEPEITRRDILQLILDDAGIGPPTGISAERDDVIVVVAGRGYRLPPLHWNELQGGWRVDLLAADTVFKAIASVPRFDLYSSSGQRSIDATGFADAHAALIQQCSQTFAAIGKPWQASAAPAPAAAGGAMQQAAMVYLSRVCKGRFHVEQQAIRTGEIDGDGTEDAVVDMRYVRCLTGHPNPSCGIQLCSVVVLLSSVHHIRGPFEDSLAMGVRLQPLTNGNMAVATEPLPSTCQQITGQPSCEILKYWNGRDLVRLN